MINAPHDIEAYRGALGYSVSGDHNGLLSDGTSVKCGLCEAREKELMQLRKRDAQWNDKWKATMDTMMRYDEREEKMRKALEDLLQHRQLDTDENNVTWVGETTFELAKQALSL
jgi:hypothetical protein